MYCSGGSFSQEGNQQGRGRGSREERSTLKPFRGRLQYRPTVRIVKQTTAVRYLRRMAQQEGYSEMLEEQASDLPPCNDVTARNKSRSYKTEIQRKLEVRSFRIIEPVSDCFAATVHYRNFHLLKKLSFSDDDAVHELHKLAQKIAEQM